MILKSLRQLSVLVTVVTSKKIDAVAVGYCALAKFEPAGWHIFFMLLYEFAGRAVDIEGGGHNEGN